MKIAEDTIILKVATEFSRTPGPRFRSEGKFSGEEFRETILKDRFDQVIKEGTKLQIDLDGGYGYAPSFLEEVAFGGTSRAFTVRISSYRPPRSNRMRSHT